ncbi:MAG TPA: FMN-binding protein [Trebonia sp.]
MRRVILAICATAVALVLLLSFKSHTQSAAPGSSPAAALGSPTPGGADTTPSAGSTGSAGTASPDSSAGSPGSASGGTAQSGAAKTVTGAAWPTVYGPVQVKITVSGGKITAAAATEYPTDTPRDAQINAFAIPQLNAEAVAAGSAQIDAVSGATYTSQGYLGSLQNALDKANG